MSSNTNIQVNYMSADLFRSKKVFNLAFISRRCLMFGGEFNYDKVSVKIVGARNVIPEVYN